jgi:hypothetical protein
MDVLPSIHQTIGCKNAKILPNLACRLSSAPKTENPIVLATKNDWEGLVDAVRVDNANRKLNLQGVVPIDVKIIVPDEVISLIRDYRLAYPCFQYLNVVQVYSKKIGSANAAPKGATSTLAGPPK